MANILVVDDIEDNVFLLTMILEKLGHRVLPAYNGQAGLDAARSERPDLVILDVMMPEMSGLEVAARLKISEATRHIPIILLTAKKGDVKDIVEGLAAGANEYLTKPFHETELVARVNSMLRTKELFDEVASAKAIMMEELRMAQAVQESLLPTVIPYPEQIQFFAHYEAASSLGGDFYDILDYGSGRVGVVMADVSGHGPSAALIVSMVKAILHSLAGPQVSPKDALERLNLSLLKMIPEDRFVTIFLGALDIATGELSYVRAGHPHALVVSKATGKVTRLEGDGDIIGMFDKIDLDQKTIRLEKGDRLLAYSDGLLDASGDSGQQYGLPNLITSMESSANLTGREMMDNIVRDVRGFTGGAPLEDDMALFILERL
ncbi:MAG: fused response regulator/phosphatase [Nitrospinae bacterium]|nr:fused response regulator/phosphatase [Nitrospinota bacterium]